MLAFAEGAGKKVFASLEILLTSRKELLKSIGKLRKVLAFAEVEQSQDTFYPT